MINLVERIDFEIEKRSLLRHPFYQMWSEGKLTHDHLRTYSKEYFQLVKAVSRNELVGCIGTDKTNASISDLTHLTSQSLEVAAAAMYAYEMELPKISRSKIDGLKKFYGMENNTDATNYFEIHEEADVRHAQLWRNIIKRTSPEKEEAVFNAALISLRAQNKLLDSVQEMYVNI